MFVLLENQKDIVRAQRLLERVVHRDFGKRTVRDIGFPGDTLRGATVRTSGRYWFHTHDDRSAKIPRKVNWFGILTDASSLEISVEINTAYDRADARVAGLFARDNETGAVCLFHTGGVGGGTKGVGKTNFLAYSNPKLVSISRSRDRPILAVLLLRLDSMPSTSSIKGYMDSIAEFKRAVRRGEISAPRFEKKKKAFRDFYSEARGRRVGKRSSEIDYISRHGDILDALHDWRKRQGLNGGRIVKDQLFDMGVERRGHLTEVYEVKSSGERQDLYTAIGQALVHGSGESCRRVIVIPSGDQTKEDLQAALDRLKIGVVRFKLLKKRVLISAPG